MVLSVKYALDAQNNVGIFSADLKPGESTVVFREEKNGGTYQVSLMNEGGVLFVRIVDPDREAKGEPTKVRKQAQPNEVFSVGSATIMIMSTTGQSAATKSTPNKIPSSMPTTQGHTTTATLTATTSEAPVTQIGPDTDDEEHFTQNPVDHHEPDQVFATSAAAEQSHFTPDHEPVEKPKTKPQVPSGVDEENTLVRQMRQNKSDPADLPPVDGSKLNFDFRYKNLNGRVGPSKDQSKNIRARADIRTRSREQLFTEDVRDRRFFLKGAKYSLRNKVSALVLGLGFAGIGIYSVGVSQIADRAQSAVFSDGIQAQTQMRGAELRERLKNYNLTLNSLVQVLSQDKLDPAVLSKGFINYDFLLGIGVFKYRTAAEIEGPKPALISSAAKRKYQKSGAQKSVALLASTPKYDLTKLKKLDDGNYLQPVVQWVRDNEATVSRADSYALTLNQIKKVTDTLSKSGSGPPVFDFREMTMPTLDKGVYTYVMRSQPISPVFVVIQTTPRFLGDMFENNNDVEYFLVSNKWNVEFPESAKGNLQLLNEIRNSLGGDRIPASQNGFSTSVPVTSNWDLVGRPNSFKTNALKSESAMYFVYGILVLLVFFVVGIWFAKNITQPLFYLIRQIESVAAGDYHKKFEINSNDEIGQVADYFEFLTGQVKRKEQELVHVTHLASKDSLTGLYNHRYFRSQLEAKWKEIEFGKGGSIILIDIDDFRIFNRAHGHIQGDLILKDLAQAVSEVVGLEKLVARYGAEELVVWAPEADQKASFDLAENILKKIRAIKTLNLVGGNSFTVTCSLGVTTYLRGRHNDIDLFLKDADSNLSMAKKAGKNRIWAGTV